MANNTIPSDRSGWARSFGELSAETEVLEMAIAKDGFPLIGAFFKACLNTKTMDDAGAQPVLSMLQKIDQVQDSDSLAQALAFMWVEGFSSIQKLLSFFMFQLQN